MRKILRVDMVLGDAISKLDVCVDLEPCSKVHNLLAIKLNNTKIGQMTNLKVVVPFIKLI